MEQTWVLPARHPGQRAAVGVKSAVEAPLSKCRKKVAGNQCVVLRNREIKKHRQRIWTLFWLY